GRTGGRRSRASYRGDPLPQELAPLALLRLRLKTFARRMAERRAPRVQGQAAAFRHRGAEGSAAPAAAAIRTPGRNRAAADAVAHRLRRLRGLAARSSAELWQLFGRRFE